VKHENPTHEHRPSMTTLQLIDGNGKSGVLGAGRIYRATKLLEK
jgi:hypothetical protein